jgi:hypothetical protein
MSADPERTGSCGIPTFVPRSWAALAGIAQGCKSGGAAIPGDRREGCPITAGKPCRPRISRQPDENGPTSGWPDIGTVPGVDIPEHNTSTYTCRACGHPESGRTACRDAQDGGDEGCRACGDRPALRQRDRCSVDGSQRVSPGETHQQAARRLHKRLTAAPGHDPDSGRSEPAARKAIISEPEAGVVAQLLDVLAGDRGPNDELARLARVMAVRLYKRLCS